jgi:hypothetical protein
MATIIGAQGETIMKLLIKLLLGWGVLDGMFLASRPREWSQFWIKGVALIGADKRVAGAVAALQTAMCTYLLRKL